MENADPGDEAAERGGRQERLERRRGGEDDAVGPDPTPGGQDEEEPHLEEVEAEQELEKPTEAALGHPDIVGGEWETSPEGDAGGKRRADERQPRGDALRLEVPPELEGGGADERDGGALWEEDGAPEDRDGASDRGAGAERGASAERGEVL